MLQRNSFFELIYVTIWASLVAQMENNSPAMQEPQETQVQSLGWEDPLEQEMAVHLGILVWRIPWIEQPGRLQSMGCKESDTAERLSRRFTYEYMDGP